MSAEFDALIQKGKYQDWLDFKQKWMCKTDSCKIPGLLKIGIYRERSLFFNHIFCQKKKQLLEVILAFLRKRIIWVTRTLLKGEHLFKIWLFYISR